jgi:hypothetical protein
VRSATLPQPLSVAPSSITWTTPGSFAISVGLVTGIVTGVGATLNPYIEYYADNLPERRLGVLGIGLILCGFALQSLQYWLALFECTPELSIRCSRSVSSFRLPQFDRISLGVIQAGEPAVGIRLWVNLDLDSCSSTDDRVFVFGMPFYYGGFARFG